MIPTLGKITPYPFQWELAQNTLTHIRKQMKGEIKPTPAYINAYVSAGKTILAGIIANHCHKVGARLLVLARTGELVEQNSDEIFNMDSPCSIFSASLDRKSVHFNTVVGSEGTVANALVSHFTAWVPHIILIDECHEVNWNDVLEKGESCYSKIINHFQLINPNVVIIGMTGSPYRGIESIRGPFWKTELEPAIDRKFLVDNEYIVPTIFGYGHDDVQYDLNKFTDIEEYGTKDFSNNQLEEMHDQMELTTTHKIMREVMQKMEGRLSALITCAGAKHCQEAASVVPDDEYAIITDKTGKKDRQQILRDVKKHVLNDRGTPRYKYIFQIGCLTTGVNVPPWDTSVLLRRIGSLTLLTQLLGRGMRILKDFLLDMGLIKGDHLVLDYSGTMAAMHQMFDDPFLEDAVLAKAKEIDKLLKCPDCDTMNSEYARRCIGPDSLNNQPDDRCGHFWQSRICEDQRVNGLLKVTGCGCENDITARECRNCHVQLIDPNAKLTGKSYDSGDWKPCLRMSIDITGKNADGICVTYWLDVWGENGRQEVAKVNYWAIQGGGKRTWTSQFVRRHINGYPFQQKILSMSAKQVVGNKAFFDVPRLITHRINEKGHSIVHGLRFNSGKTLRGDKRVQEEVA
jgi:superfamily II DNA or RNA helicase